MTMNRIMYVFVLSVGLLVQACGGGGTTILSDGMSSGGGCDNAFHREIIGHGRLIRFDEQSGIRNRETNGRVVVLMGSASEEALAGTLNLGTPHGFAQGKQLTW